MGLAMAGVLTGLPVAGMDEMPGPKDGAQVGHEDAAPVGRDYEYTLLQVEPDPTRHRALGYLGGDPFVTKIVDHRPESHFGGQFRIPRGAARFMGMAVKVSRGGHPGPLEIRFGTSPGQDDIGVARLEWQDVLPLYEPWTKARIAPRTVRPGDSIHFEVRGTAGESPTAHYVVYGPRPRGSKPSPEQFGLAYRVLTDRPQDDVDQSGKAYAFQHVRELLGPYYADDPSLRLDGQPPADGETAIETGWGLHFTPDPEQIMETAAQDLATFLSLRAGLRVMAKTEHAVSQEFITIPYIPCLRQWHDRVAKMAEFELEGFYGNWCHYGYTPSRPAEILMWYSWTGAPPLPDLLSQLAARDFGPGAAEQATRAWERFTRGIQAFPYSDPVARYPGPLQKGPSQPLLLDPQAKMPGGARSWQNNLNWTKPWGPDLTAKYFTVVEREFRAGIEELEQAKAAASEHGRRELDAEIGVAETIARSLHSMINLIAWVRARDAYAKAGRGASRDRLRKQLAAVAEDELANARAALVFLEADSRLGCTSEAIGSRRGGLFSPALVRTKIGMLEELLSRQLAADP